MNELTDQNTDSVLIQIPDEDQTTPLMLAWSVELEPEKLEVIRNQSRIAMVRKNEPNCTQILILSGLSNTPELDPKLAQKGEQSLPFTEYQAHNLSTLSATQTGWILSGNSWSVLWNSDATAKNMICSLEHKTQSQHTPTASTHWSEFRWWLQVPGTDSTASLATWRPKTTPLTRCLWCILDPQW